MDCLGKLYIEPFIQLVSRMEKTPPDGRVFPLHSPIFIVVILRLFDGSCDWGRVHMRV